MTDLRTCPACDARVIHAGDHILDWQPCPDGTIAAQHTAAGPWLARALQPGEEPLFPEKRHVEHWRTCTRPDAGAQRVAADAVREVTAGIRAGRRKAGGEPQLPISTRKA